ncbi:MAG: PAS domain S-box protein [Sedimentisphaerales bacterium]|nr:PAS domain S-box protein [Sedimentisphaerales bacterium]
MSQASPHQVETLAQSQAAYKVLFESSPDGIAIAEVETMEFIHCNPALCRMLGYSEEELKGLGVKDIHTKEDLNWVVSEFQALARRKKTLARDIPFLRKDRTIVYADISATKALIDGKECNIGFFRDVTERRKTEEEFKNIFDLSPDMIAVFNIEGQLVKANLACQKILGFTQEELLELHQGQLVHPEDMERTFKEAEKILRGEPVEKFVIRYRCKDGSYKTLEWQVVAAGGFVYTTARDVVEREQAAEALRKEKDFAQSLIETAQTIILVLDTTGAIVDFNPYMEEISGYRIEEVRGKEWFATFLPKGCQSKIRELFIKTVKDINSQGINPIVTKDGRQRLIEWYNKTLKDSDGEVIGVLATGQDITERKENEAALKESEERYRTMFEQAASPIMLIDPATGNIEQFNDRMCENLGYSRGEFEKLRLTDIDHTDHPAKIAQHLERIIAEGEDIFETKHKTKDGQLRDIIVSIKVISIGGRQLIQAVHRDVTESREAEEKLVELDAELVHASRVGVMAEFTAALAHEINHPLGSILNNANAAKRYLEKDKPDLDQIREIVDDIISEDRRANQIIQKLRALMKKVEAQYSPLEINEIIEEVLTLANSELVIKNISLSRQFAEDLGRVNGDRVQLQQVLLNLVINAADAMEDSEIKNIYISTSKEDSENILICVRDTGTGIDEDKSEKLFTPFFTTKEEGMGMGLSVNKTIIEAHRGDIWAENNQEGGASFFIRLPIYKENQNE